MRGAIDTGPTADPTLAGWEARAQANRLIEEVKQVRDELDPGYGEDALAIAYGAVAGRHKLDPAEYVPKLDELYWRSLK